MSDLAQRGIMVRSGRVLRTVRAGVLGVLSRVQQRLPHLSAHDVAEIDREVRQTLTEIGAETA